MRFLADQNVSPLTVSFLREAGHDAIRVSEVLPHNAPDRIILAFAARERRVVLTHDLDYSGLLVTERSPVASLVLMRLSTTRVEQVNEILRRVLPTVEAVLETGAIVVVEDASVRVRPLPPG